MLRSVIVSVNCEIGKPLGLVKVDAIVINIQSITDFFKGTS